SSFSYFMDKSSFGSDESCIPHHEDLLSSTIIMGDEDHKRDDLKFSPIFGDTSPSGKVGLRYRNAPKPVEDDESEDGDERETIESADLISEPLDFPSEIHVSESQEGSSQIDAQCGDAAFIEEKENSSKEQQRTPENSHSDTRIENESKRAVNPFERSICAESLSRSIFSPGILAELSNLPKNTPKTREGEFKWSIEHLAVLHPVDIPEEDIVRSRISPSSFNNPTKQAAIESFFRSSAAYHPSPDVFRKPPTPLTAPSAKRLRPLPPPTLISSSLLLPSPLTRPPAARLQRATQLQRSRTCCTQTSLSIPPSDDIDLLAILGVHYTYDEDEDRERRISEGIEDEEDEKDLSASNLSLRRRLFLNDPDEEEEMETSALANEAGDILTPLSSDTPSSSMGTGNRSSSSLFEDLGSGGRRNGSLVSPSTSRIIRMSPFPDFSPIS
ncbi:hypothetical protein PFISCL1PPCAC_15148, partial [Pristionchus fissidentatus]